MAHKCHKLPKCGYGLIRILFKFINVPVPSIQFHFDSFVPFKIFKPIANLNILFMFFSELIKIILK